jgi:cell wall-associated NlpC family hydrolase
MPFLDVACKNGRSEPDVYQLGCCFFWCFGGFCHVGVVIDGGEYIHDGLGVVVGSGFYFWLWWRSGTEE